MTAHKGECFGGARACGNDGQGGGHGILPLPLLPLVVGRTGERAVRVTAGAEHLATFAKTPVSQRQYCRKCGGHRITNHPPLALVDVFAATLPTLKFAPGVHVNDAETVLPIRDGRPELKDFSGGVRRLRRNDPGVIGHRFLRLWSSTEGAPAT